MAPVNNNKNDVQSTQVINRNGLVGKVVEQPSNMAAHPEKRASLVTWTVLGSNKGPNVDSKNGDKKESPKQDNLGQEIGLLYGSYLIMNTIIGPGIFGTPKAVVAGTGSIGVSLIVWAFCGMFSTFAALCFAELRESVQREGVEYAYITEAFGSIFGFVYTVMRVAAAEPTASAIFALAFTDYITDALMDRCGETLLFLHLLGTLVVLSIYLINVLSSRLAEKFHLLCSLGKLMTVGVVVIMGIVRMSQGKLTKVDDFESFKHSPTDLAFACFNGLWSFGGWANVNMVTSGIKKPPRNVPRLVKVVIPCVMVLYLLIVLSFYTAMDKKDMPLIRALGVTWAQEVLGPAAAVIYVGVGLVALGSLNNTFLTAGRLYGVAAKNKQMPDLVSWVHVSSKTSLVACTIKCAMAIIAIFLATLQQLIRFYVFTVWLFHGTSIVALLVLRYKKRRNKTPYKVDLWIPVLVVTGIVFFIVAPFLRYPEPEFIGAASILGISFVIFFPIKWLQSLNVFHIPDKVVIVMQLLLGIAPKQALRRERREMRRRVSQLVRENLSVTSGLAFSSDRLISAALLKHETLASRKRLSEDSTGLRRRTPAGKPEVHSGAHNQTNVPTNNQSLNREDVQGSSSLPIQNIQQKSSSSENARDSSDSAVFHNDSISDVANVRTSISSSSAANDKPDLRVEIEEATILPQEQTGPRSRRRTSSRGVDEDLRIEYYTGGDEEETDSNSSSSSDSETDQIISELRRFSRANSFSTSDSSVEEGDIDDNVSLEILVDKPEGNMDSSVGGNVGQDETNSVTPTHSRQPSRSDVFRTSREPRQRKVHSQRQSSSDDRSLKEESTTM